MGSGQSTGEPFSAPAITPLAENCAEIGEILRTNGMSSRATLPEGAHDKLSTVPFDSPMDSQCPAGSKANPGRWGCRTQLLNNFARWQQ